MDYPVNMVNHKNIICIAQKSFHYIQAFAYQWEYAYLPEVNAFPI